MEKSYKKDNEKDIEKKLYISIKKVGGHALKFSSVSESGYPDRIILLPRGRIYWVELKSLGKKLRKLQQIRKTELEELGFEVETIDSFSALDNFINKISHGR